MNWTSHGYAGRLPTPLRRTLLPLGRYGIPGIVPDTHLNVSFAPDPIPEYGVVLALARLGVVRLMRWYLDPKKSEGILTVDQYTGFEPRRRSLEYACWYGNLKMVKWLHSYLGDGFEGRLGIMAALMSGNVRIAQWIYEYDLQSTKNPSRYFLSVVIVDATRNEDEEALRFLYDSGIFKTGITLFDGLKPYIKADAQYDAVGHQELEERIRHNYTYLTLAETRNHI